MSTTSTSTQVPKLRFPGFEGEWEQGRVDSFLVLQRGFDLTKKTSGEGNYPVYSSSGISYYHDEFKVCGPGLVTGRKGSVGPVFFVKEDFWPHDTSLWVKDFKGNDVSYCYFFLTQFDLSRFDEASSVPTLNRNNVHREKAAFPTVPEQQKIAAFLTAVDGRIEQLSRKKALLEAYKKGVMQQLFTQTLRFQDDHGHDFPNWEEKTLGDVADFLDSKRVPLSQEERSHKQGPYRYYGASGVIDHVDEFIFDGEYVLLGEDGANIITRSTRLAFVVSGKFWVNNHAHVLKAHGSSLFLAEALEQLDYSQYNTGTAQPKLNAKVCQQIRLQLPSLPEQTKIAGFLSALDGKIRAVGEQMRQTQAWKKGLLQQLFV